MSRKSRVLVLSCPHGTSIGFALLLINALGYLLNWDTSKPALTIFGLIFVTIGLKFIRKV